MLCKLADKLAAGFYMSIKLVLIAAVERALHPKRLARVAVAFALYHEAGKRRRHIQHALLATAGQHSADGLVAVPDAQPHPCDRIVNGAFALRFRQTLKARQGKPPLLEDHRQTVNKALSLDIQRAHPQECKRSHRLYDAKSVHHRMRFAARRPGFAGKGKKPPRILRQQTARNIRPASRTVYEQPLFYEQRQYLIGRGPADAIPSGQLPLGIKSLVCMEFACAQLLRKFSGDAAILRQSG